MKYKYSSSILVLSLSSITSPSIAAQPINSSPITYDYIGAGFGVGESQLNTQIGNFRFKTNTLDLTLSKKLSEGFYLKLASTKATTDDSDFDNGFKAKLDDRDRQTNALIGAYLPLDPNFHLIGEVGINYADTKTSVTFTPFSTRVSAKNSDTDFMWRVGVRSSWSNAFEMNANYFKSGDTNGWTLNGPIKLTHNLAIDILYTQAKNTSDDRKYKSKILGATLRYLF